MSQKSFFIFDGAIFCQFFKPRPQPAQALLPAEYAADLNSSAGRDGDSGRRYAHRPHELCVFHLLVRGDGCESAEYGLVGPLRQGLERGDDRLEHLAGGFTV